ncbi:type VI secretion system tube protein Hcp, partial [Escherichia coli]|nr:type VI secretion system tube protein Hcp [Escherichia coli]
FNNFDEFRGAFWTAVGECPELLSQFSKANQTLIKRGRAPYTVSKQRVGGRGHLKILNMEEFQ